MALVGTDRGARYRTREAEAMALGAAERVALNRSRGALSVEDLDRLQAAIEEWGRQRAHYLRTL